MNYYRKYPQGFSLVELMIATVIGLLLSYAVMQIYVIQTQIYKTTNSQALIQSAENAIANLVIPVVRSAGFIGCGSINNAMSDLNGGGSNPLGSLSTNSTLIAGYNGNGTSISLQDNVANSNNASDWSPNLDPTLLGNVQKYNDVLVVFGAVPGSFPASISAISSGSNSFTVQSTSGVTLSSGQFAAVSDCVKASVFQITGVSDTTIAHAAGTGVYGNASSNFTVNYQAGAQFIPLQQTAFFVGQGPGGQSALMRGILTSTGWTIDPLVPGVELMKVQYAIGGYGTNAQYVTANAVSNWAQVYAVRIGFLIGGKAASGIRSTTNYTVLDTAVTVPNDNRLRQVYYIDIHLRNAYL